MERFDLLVVGAGMGGALRQGGRTRSDLVAVVLLVAAALIHIVLFPEHMRESLLFGAVFSTIALFQLGLAWALWIRAGTTVRKVGRYGSLGIVVLFLGARVIAPPGQAIPDNVSWIGVLSVVLEIAAVAALAVGLPPNRARPHRTSSIAVPAVAAGVAFFLLDLVASGDLSYAQTTIPRPDSVGLYANGVNQLSPAVTVLLAHRWWLYLPLVGTAATLLVAILLAAAVWMTLRVVRLQPHCSARLGLLGAVPASLAAPVCCGPSLLSALGAGAAGALGWLAAPLLLASAVFLGADILWLRRCLRATLGSPASPRLGGRQDAA